MWLHLHSVDAAPLHITDHKLTIQQLFYRFNSKGNQLISTNDQAHDTLATFECKEKTRSYRLAKSNTLFPFLDAKLISINYGRVIIRNTATTANGNTNNRQRSFNEIEPNHISSTQKNNLI